MKKITLLFSSLFALILCITAQNLNNPKDAEGYYIVKWDCANDQWATSNNFEVDENFTFAVDVTGTPFEDWLKATPNTAGATRSIAINKWSNKGEVNANTNRLKQIKGNIYGATWNIAQMGNSGSTMNVGDLVKVDSVCYIGGQVFGFEYTNDNPGAGWWMWPSGIGEGTSIDPGTGNIFKTLAYTGSKTSAEFYNDDYPGLFDESYGDQKGYAPACANTTAGTKDPKFNAADVIGIEFYNLQGVKLNIEPEDGLFLKTSILSNGSRISEKVIKNRK